MASSLSNASVLQDVEVDASGPSFRSARTDANGNFAIYGLGLGSYNLHFSKSGYSSQDVSAALPATGVVNLTQLVSLSPAAILRLSVKRPSDGALAEIWGQVQAHTSDWSKQTSGTVHFQPGSITSDAGDTWQPTLTPYTEMDLVPDVSYQLSFNIPGHQPDTPPSPISVSVSSPTALLIHLGAATGPGRHRAIAGRRHQRQRVCGYPWKVVRTTIRTKFATIKPIPIRANIFTAAR